MTDFRPCIIVRKNPGSKHWIWQLGAFPVADGGPFLEWHYGWTLRSQIRTKGAHMTRDSAIRMALMSWQELYQEKKIPWPIPLGHIEDFVFEQVWGS